MASHLDFYHPKRYTKTLARNSHGPWYRASRYVLIGDAIAPAPDATIEAYDPWDAFNRVPEQKERRSGVIPRPYSPFLELGNVVRREVEIAFDFDSRITDLGRSLVMEWVEAYGLLGILPSETEFIVLPRTPGVVQQALRPSRLDASVWEISKCFAGNFPGIQAEGVRITRTGTGLGLFFTPASITVPDYFPGHDPFHDASCWTENFKRWYGEPVWEIAYVAKIFLEASLQQSELESSVDYGIWLKRLSDGAMPQFVFNSGKPNYTQSSTALLASFAQMLLWDWIEGLQVTTCSACGKPFVRNNDTVTYCGKTCRGRIKQQRKRERDKQKLVTQRNSAD